MKIVNYKLKIILSVLFLFFPVVVLAAGLVPCEGINCTFCSFFILFQNIFNFAVTILAPAVAVFGIAYGGYFILIGGANSSNITKGKDALKNTAIGFVIVYAAYAMASTLVWFFASGFIGGSGVQFGFSGGTFNFACSTNQLTDVTSGIMTGGVINIRIREPDPTVGTGDLPSDTTVSNVIVKKSNNGVNITDLNSDVQQALSRASSDANLNNIELVVTSGKRNLADQNREVARNCPVGATKSSECSPETCIPTGDGSNCEHTTGNAVDVKGRNPDTGVQCPRISICEQNVIKIMKNHGFCVYSGEPWHFELQSSLIGTSRISVFNCN